MNSSTTTAMAHSSMPGCPWRPRCLGPGRAPRPHAASRHRGQCSRPASGETMTHTCPRQAGLQASAGPGPRRAAAASWGRPGGRMPELRQSRAQLSRSQPANFEARRRRGAQLAWPALARGASMPGAGAAPLFTALSGPKGSRAQGAAAAARRGSPALPVAPASIAAPRALISLGAATCGEESPAGSPHRPTHAARARPGRGGDVAPPAPASPADGALAPSQRYPASPRVPERSRGFAESLVQGGAVWLGRAGAGREQQHSPGAVGAPLSRWRGAEPAALYRRARTQLAFGGSGSPLAPGYFPQPSVHGGD